MTFDWDTKKRQTNIKKHRIDFSELKKVFEKPMLTRFDNREDYGETRWISLGDLTGKIVILVYTETENNVRLISARRATKNEENIYCKKVYNR